MPYIDKDYYDNEYFGEPFPDGTTDMDFNRLAQRASEVIDMVTNYKLVNDASLMENDFISKQVKLATAAQTEFFMKQGGYADIISGEADAFSVNIGSFSYTNSASNAMGANITPSRQDITKFVLSSVYGYLGATGLLYSGVDFVAY